MRALTLYQPWASLVAVGAKRVETRSWYTPYRGPLAIHAGRSAEGLPLCREEPFCSALAEAGYPTPRELPLGAIVATCVLTRCLPVSNGLYDTLDLDSLSERERAFGDYSPGRYAWLLSDIIRVVPVPVRGFQGLWHWDPLFCSSEPERRQSICT